MSDSSAQAGQIKRRSFFGAVGALVAGWLGGPGLLPGAGHRGGTPRDGGSGVVVKACQLAVPRTRKELQ